MRGEVVRSLADVLCLVVVLELVRAAVVDEDLLAVLDVPQRFDVHSAVVRRQVQLGVRLVEGFVVGKAAR